MTHSVCTVPSVVLYLVSVHDAPCVQCVMHPTDMHDVPCVQHLVHPECSADAP